MLTPAERVLIQARQVKDASWTYSADVGYRGRLPTDDPSVTTRITALRKRFEVVEVTYEGGRNDREGKALARSSIRPNN